MSSLALYGPMPDSELRASAQRYELLFHRLREVRGEAADTDSPPCDDSAAAAAAAPPRDAAKAKKKVKNRMQGGIGGAPTGAAKKKSSTASKATSSVAAAACEAPPPAAAASRFPANAPPTSSYAAAVGSAPSPQAQAPPAKAAPPATPPAKRATKTPPPRAATSGPVDLGRVRMRCSVMEKARFAKACVHADTVFAPGAEEAGAAKLRAVMEEEGYVVVLGVCSPEECRVMEGLWQNDLLTLAGDSRNYAKGTAVRMCYDAVASERAEGGAKAWPDATIFHNKFNDKRGLEHGGFAWAGRTNKKAQKVFSALTETPVEELCGGLDTVFFNSKEPAHPVHDDRYWMHVDYNEVILPRRGAFQGVLYTWGADDDTASTTVVWPGSHKSTQGEGGDLSLYDRLVRDESLSTVSRRHHCTHMKCDPTLRRELVEGSLEHARRLPIPAGSLLVWHPKLSHQGWAAGRRLAAPICFEPRKHRAPDALRRKLWLCAAGLPSSHWATLGKVHTRQEELCQTTSEATPDTAPVPSDTHQVLLPCYASILPYCVRPDKIREWQRLVPRIFRGGAVASADACNEAAAEEIRSLLRPEVLAIL
eukprot:Rhum_TRINITY_DN1696_c0_g1::Rhum_TRINITY_DN1696_c0_g1_i1::g.4627::m.4627